MMKYNPANESVKKQYEEALLHGRHREKRTVDAVWKSINAFENYTNRQDFRTFSKDQAKGFKHHLEKQTNAKGQPLSLSTIRSTLSNVRDFFIWLTIHPKYIRKLDGRAIEFLRLSDNQERAGRASRERPAPTVEEVCKVLEAMPHSTDVEKRDRAIIAFTLLTGVRDGALISLKQGDVDLEKNEVWQNPRHVNTKNRKGIVSLFIPTSPLAEEIVRDWISYSQNTLGMGLDDPLFPKQKIANNPETLQFESAGFAKEHWANATPVRQIFQRAFEAIGLPKSRPHSIRNTIVIWALENCNQFQFKSISQSLGHEHAMTTYNNYGSLSWYDVRRGIESVHARKTELKDISKEDLIAEISRRTI